MVIKKKNHHWKYQFYLSEIWLFCWTIKQHWLLIGFIETQQITFLCSFHLQILWNIHEDKQKNFQDFFFRSYFSLDKLKTLQFRFFFSSIFRNECGKWASSFVWMPIKNYIKIKIRIAKGKKKINFQLVCRWTISCGCSGMRNELFGVANCVYV